MENALVLTTAEQGAIATVIDNGSSSIDANNSGDLATALLKVGTETYIQAMKIVSENSQLRKDVVGKLSTAVNKAIKANEENSQKAIDNAIENSKAIRALMNSGDCTADEFRSYVDELRMYAQDINRLTDETRESNAQVVNQHQKTMNKAMDKSNTARDIAIGVGGFAAGAILATIIHNMLKKN